MYPPFATFACVVLTWIVAYRCMHIHMCGSHRWKTNIIPFLVGLNTLVESLYGLMFHPQTWYTIELSEVCTLLTSRITTYCSVVYILWLIAWQV